jgi:hypothetical protein
MKPIWRIFLLIFTFSLAIYSQSSKNTNDPQVQEELNRQNIERDLEQRMSNMRRLNDEPIRSEANILPIDWRSKFPAAKRKHPEAIKKILLPNSEDSSRYQNFLRQPKTGLFRLFPDLNCGSKVIVRVDGECADTIPGTWLYSFRLKDFSDDYFDISLKNGNFTGGGFLSQSILVQLGNTPLETVSPTTSGMQFLFDFKPEKKFAVVKKQALQIAEGIEVNGYKYLKTIDASDNMTYAMRLIAYRNENRVANRSLRVESPAEDIIKYLAVNLDKRTDIILAFRIVRRDSNGSLTILWKELNRQNAPEIVFEKNEKLSDIR